MLESLRKWLITLVGLALFAGAVVGLAECDRSRQQATVTVTGQIDTVILEHHDTLVKLDTLRKTRIIYIDTSKIIVLHDTLDKLIPIDTVDNDGNQVIAANQLRTALKWKDSLNTCIDMRKVDSGAIDSLVKIGKEKAPESGGLIHDLKVFGSGFLIGAGVKLLF